MSNIDEQYQNIHTSMQALAKDAGWSEEHLEEVQKALADGAKLCDVLGLSREAMESGYAYGYNLYKAGNYSDAETMFRGLCLYDGDDPRYWMGLAGCLQARGAYQLAIDTYSMAAVGGALQDPAPFYHAGLCYLKLGDAENAEAAFKAALDAGKDATPAHKVCHDKVRGLLATLAEARKEAKKVG